MSLLNSNFGQYLNHSIVKRLTKALIRLRVCAGWSEPLLVARKSHVAAQLSPILEIIHTCQHTLLESIADTKVRSKDGKKSRYNVIFLMFSVHRKQTPFVVVGSLKNYENLHDLGWYRRRLCGDFPTVFLYEVGACADPGIFVPENSSDNFLVLNFTEGAQWLFQTKLYMYIFVFFFFFGGGGGSKC